MPTFGKVKLRIFKDTKNFYIIIGYWKERIIWLYSKQRKKEILPEKESAICFIRLKFCRIISRKNNKNILKKIDFGLIHEYDENNGELLKTKCVTILFRSRIN